MNFKRLCLLSAALFFAWGCSSTREEKVVPTPKTYSAETEKTFEEIEREQVIETYRRLRWENWQEREQERESQITRPRARKIIPKPAPAPAAPKKAARKQSGNPEEIQVEIEQNMAIFCMKMSGNARFSDESDCSAFTQNVLFECSSKFDEADRAKVGCVKAALK